DNLTSFRIMVVSCGKSDFGSGEKDFTVSKDFMINPSILNFVRNGDEFTGGVVAVNMTKKSGEYRVECSADGALIAEEYNPKGTLGVNEKKEVLYRFKIDTDKDTVFLKFKGSLGEEEDNLLVKLPVRKNPLIHFAGIYESTEEKSKTHIIDLSSIPDATVSASFSSSGMVDVKEAAKYLFGYPYGCLEQQTSKVFPLIIGEDIINEFNIGDIKQSKIKSIVQDYLNNLSSYQQSNGGFSIWAHQGDPSSSYLTNYVFYIMLYAKRNGYKVSDNVYKKAKEYVSDIAGGKNNSPYYDYYSKSALEATKVFAVYLMKTAGMNYESYVQQYAGRIEQLDGEALAWLLLLTHDSKNYENVKERVLQRISVLSQYEGMYAYFDCNESMFDEIYGSSVKTTALLLFAMLEDTGKSMNDPEKFIFWLLKRRTAGGHWSSTQENAFVILALEKYFRTFESARPDFTASLSIDKKEIFEQVFKGYSLSQQETFFETDGNAKKNVSIKKEGEGRLFYKILVSYDSPFQQKQIDNGFEVTKTMTPYKHDNKEFLRGMLYKITLNVKTKSERMYVVVDDPVPAGFEIVNSDFVTSEFNSENNEYSYESDYSLWFGNFNHREKYFDRYLLFADWLPKGEYTQTYIVKAIYQGKYYMPTTKAEEMYSPLNYGSTESRWVEVK
ncbi:MAG: alpha-2-macroglobulin family protein, partial [bacterium]|nr:alpha-2-macroglobulin family protein [bacterium]